MISAAERYCSNRVLMLTRVKGCCHYLGAEGAVTVKCTFPGLWWLLHSLTSLRASDIQIITSLWLFMGRLINGTSQKSHWSGPVKQWSHRLWSECAEFILAWIIKNFHQIINLTVKLSSAYRLWLHVCEHELPVCNPCCILMNFSSYLIEGIYLQWTIVIFCWHVSAGSSTA